MPTLKINNSLELSYKNNHVFVNSSAGNSASLSVVMSSGKVGDIELTEDEMAQLKSKKVKEWLDKMGYKP